MPDNPEMLDPCDVSVSINEWDMSHQGPQSWIDHRLDRFFRTEEWLIEYKAPNESAMLRAKFQKLTVKWREETSHLSNPAQIARHPAYLEIIGEGEKMLPLIFEDLQEHEGHWYVALRFLTGAHPVPPEARGRTRLVREAWLQW